MQFLSCGCNSMVEYLLIMDEALGSVLNTGKEGRVSDGSPKGNNQHYFGQWQKCDHCYNVEKHLPQLHSAVGWKEEFVSNEIGYLFERIVSTVWKMQPVKCKKRKHVAGNVKKKKNQNFMIWEIFELIQITKSKNMKNVLRQSFVEEIRYSL